MTNQVTVLEPSQQTLDNLDRLKSVPPHLNLGATEMSNGNNSGIVFPPTGGDYVRGAFDVSLTYVEEEQSDGQGGTTVVSVPKVKVYNSANINSQYAGYVYSGTATWQLPVTTLTPIAGVVYVDINYELNTQTIEIAASLPSIQTTDRRWVYALAEVTQPETNLFQISRMNQPGNLQVFGRWVA